MATIDRAMGRERDDAGGQAETRAAWLTSSMVWFALGIAGMLTVFVGLGVDAWRHNNGAAEESLLSFGNPGHLIAAIGLLVAAGAMLGGFTTTAVRGLTSAEQAVRRFVPVTAAWMAVAAVGVGSVTYIAASDATVGHSHGDTTSVIASDDDQDHEHAEGGDDARVAEVLKEEGLLEEDDGDATPGDGGDHVHDHGQQPTFTQFRATSDGELLPLFPDGTVTAADLPALRDELEEVRAFAEKHPTPEAARAAGYRPTTSDVPGMGEHWLNSEYVADGEFDPSKPEGLLFSNVGPDGERVLVGVWFLLLPGTGDITRDAQPDGFAGDLDLWHAHTGLCLVGLEGASENETRESCEAKGGNFTADLRWMLHAWVAPDYDNPDGVFAYLNNDVGGQQARAGQ